MFIRGQVYTRHQIHMVVGGDLQSYLPTLDGKVVCGCFKQTARQPEAPDLVLPGDGPRVYACAKMFSEQQHAIPIFLKRDVSEWEYVGNYVVDRWTEDPPVIRQQSQLTGRDNISRVLYLRQV